MSTPPDASRSPNVAPSTPGVVLVCETCDHIWEPSPAEFGTGPVLCTQCGGWTVIGELATPTSAENRATAASDSNHGEQ